LYFNAGARHPIADVPFKKNLILNSFFSNTAHQKLNMENYFFLGIITKILHEIHRYLIVE